MNCFLHEVFLYSAQMSLSQPQTHRQRTTVSEPIPREGPCTKQHLPESPLLPQPCGQNTDRMLGGADYSELTGAIPGDLWSPGQKLGKRQCVKQHPIMLCIHAVYRSRLCFGSTLSNPYSYLKGIYSVT